MTLRDVAEEIQRSHLLAEKTLVFFRDILSDPTRNPLKLQTPPAGASPLELDAWRNDRLHEAIDQAEQLAGVWLARHPQKIHEFLISQGSEVSFLGFRSLVAIVPGQEMAVSSRPQLTMIPVEVLIPESIAQCFSIRDVRAGNRSTFVSSDPVPGLAFAARHIACRIRFPAAFPAMDYTWIVRNHGDRPLFFEASFKGPICEV